MSNKKEEGFLEKEIKDKKHGVRQEYKKTLLDLIVKMLPDCKIYLFGSRATGTYQEGSDIDLALDNNGNIIDINIILSLYNDIEETSIPLFVDLVDINTAGDELKKQIMAEGVLWKK